MGGLPRIRILLKILVECLLKIHEKERKDLNSPIRGKTKVE